MRDATWEGFAAVLGINIEVELARPRPHRTDRPARGRNNARVRRDGRASVAWAHRCAAARLDLPKLPRRLKKTLWRQDPEYFC